MFNSKTIKVCYILCIHIKSYPMSSHWFSLIKIYCICPNLYFRYIIFWINTIKFRFVLIFSFISKFVEGWGDIKISDQVYLFLYLLLLLLALLMHFLIYYQLMLLITLGEIHSDISSRILIPTIWYCCPTSGAPKKKKTRQKKVCSNLKWLGSA